MRLITAHLLYLSDDFIGVTNKLIFRIFHLEIALFRINFNEILMDIIDNSNIKYSINLSFEEIKLPPFQDILILGKNSPQGKIGLCKSFELLAPNGFHTIEINDDKVEAVFINKKILNKISSDKIIEILKLKVFQFISEGELIKVDFKIVISYINIEIEK